mmetsp:Transcript_7279/g.22527  ORF Transcript_7279/g.22527 Transcript_7279/m.22527 type:complete len:347 (-) Transcript_7279:940-1980(-)
MNGTSAQRNVTALATISSVLLTKPSEHLEPSLKARRDPCTQCRAPCATGCGRHSVSHPTMCPMLCRLNGSLLFLVIRQLAISACPSIMRKSSGQLATGIVGRVGICIRLGCGWLTQLGRRSCNAPPYGLRWSVLLGIGSRMARLCTDSCGARLLYLGNVILRGMWPPSSMMRAIRLGAGRVRARIGALARMELATGSSTTFGRTIATYIVPSRSHCLFVPKVPCASGPQREIGSICVKEGYSIQPSTHLQSRISSHWRSNIQTRALSKSSARKAGRRVLTISGLKRGRDVLSSSKEAFAMPASGPLALLRTRHTSRPRHLPPPRRRPYPCHHPRAHPRLQPRIGCH